jgi:hypothetical protein
MFEFYSERVRKRSTVVVVLCDVESMPSNPGKVVRRFLSSESEPAFEARFEDCEIDRMIVWNTITHRRSDYGETDEGYCCMAGC